MRSVPREPQVPANSSRTIVRRLAIVFVLTGVLAVIVLISVGRVDEHCFNDKLKLTDLGPTLQTIHERAPYGNYLIRGHITKYAKSGRFIVGYLSMKHTVDDGLVGLTGPNDKEGYFLIDETTLEVRSGLSSDAARKVLAADGIDESKIKYMSGQSARERFSCVLTLTNVRGDAH